MKAPPFAVVDTNIIVAGLLTADLAAPTAHILDTMLAGSLPFVLSIELLSEYRRVLLRPKIAERHALSAEQIDSMLTQLATNGIMRLGLSDAPEAPDRGDKHLWALLYAAPNPVVLLTGDALLHEQAPKGISVVTARGYWEKWG